MLNFNFLYTRRIDSHFFDSVLLHFCPHLVSLIRSLCSGLRCGACYLVSGSLFLVAPSFSFYFSYKRAHINFYRLQSFSCFLLQLPLFLKLQEKLCRLLSPCRRRRCTAAAVDHRLTYSVDYTQFTSTLTTLTSALPCKPI